HVFERPGDWNTHTHQKGYWFVEEPEAYRPGAELGAFLARGDKPVYIGFGSMFDKADSERVSRVAIDALALAGKRGILSGMGDVKGLPDSVMAAENVPHSWLFPRMAAACHHGGAGTSAAGFQAGVPSIIVPFALDQYAWAQRSYELGIGSKPLPFKTLTAQRLAEAISFSSRPEIRAKAAALGQLIADEHGARDCALVIATAMEAKPDGGD
ncbi:MAG TPA: glycosyltransferase, partial [Spirochaetaceae bacterium]|nr:glycosyltransferase [Spirochaetaceae bacterium]